MVSDMSVELTTPPFDAVMFIGDLNYRLEVSRSQVSPYPYLRQICLVDVSTDRIIKRIFVSQSIATQTIKGNF